MAFSLVVIVILQRGSMLAHQSPSHNYRPESASLLLNVLFLKVGGGNEGNGVFGVIPSYRPPPDIKTFE